MVIMTKTQEFQIGDKVRVVIKYYEGRIGRINWKRDYYGTWQYGIEGIPVGASYDGKFSSNHLEKIND